METIKASIKYLPLVVGIAILAAIAAFSPWQDINGLLRRVTWQEYGLLTLLAIAFYASKVARYWVMLKMLKIPVSFGVASRAYIAAQPVTVLPAGELYRSVLLKRYAGVPVADSSPTVTAQGLMEAVVLLAAAFAGAVVIRHNQATIALSAAGLFILLFILRRGWLKDKHGAFNKLPFVSVSRGYYNKFVLAHRRLLRPDFLWTLLSLSLFPVALGIAILFASAAAIDQPVSWPEAGIAYSLPAVLSGVSILPGGVGANEGSSIGILRLASVGSAAAVAITLLARVFTLVAGVIFGLIALALSSLTKVPNEDISPDQP